MTKLKPKDLPNVVSDIDVIHKLYIDEVLGKFRKEFFEDDMSAVRHVDTDTNQESEMEMIEKFIKDTLIKFAGEVETLRIKPVNNKTLAQQGYSVDYIEYNEASDDVLAKLIGEK
jgi:hypothetical protein